MPEDPKLQLVSSHLFMTELIFVYWTGWCLFVAYLGPSSFK